MSEELSTEMNALKRYLKSLAFELNTYGAAIAQPFISAGLPPAQAASHIALASFAQDVHEAESDSMILLELQTQAEEILETLVEFMAKGLIEESVWRSDANTFIRVSSADEHQAEWVTYVLGERSLDNHRMAVNCHPKILACRANQDADFINRIG
jgi:hypothetical protein